MKDNNKALLARLRKYNSLIRMAEIQAQLQSNKKLQDAKTNQIESEYCTAENPII